MGAGWGAAKEGEEGRKGGGTHALPQLCGNVILFQHVPLELIRHFRPDCGGGKKSVYVDKCWTGSADDGVIAEGGKKY